MKFSFHQSRITLESEGQSKTLSLFHTACLLETLLNCYEHGDAEIIAKKEHEVLRHAWEQF